MGSAEPLIIRIILHCLCEKNVHAAHPFCPLRTNSYRQQSSCGTTSNKLPPSHAPPEIDERWADGDASRLPSLARELVQLQPDVIAATGTSETKALRAATQDIPVAFLQVADPISSGLVASIPRPGGNITGLMQGAQMRLGLLIEMIGRQPRRLAWLGNPANSGTASNWADAQDAVRHVGADVVRIELSRAEDLELA